VAMTTGHAILQGSYKTWKSLKILELGSKKSLSI
jgi:hypothetical protein